MTSTRWKVVAVILALLADAALWGFVLHRDRGASEAAASAPAGTVSSAPAAANRRVVVLGDDAITAVVGRAVPGEVMVDSVADSGYLVSSQSALDHRIDAAAKRNADLLVLALGTDDTPNAAIASQVEAAAEPGLTAAGQAEVGPLLAADLAKVTSARG